MPNITHNLIVKSVQSDGDWEVYLDLMWQKMRQADKLPRYSKEDFLEPGNINLIALSNEEVIAGMYAKKSPHEASCLVVHRFATNADLSTMAFLLREVESRADEYARIKLLVTSTGEAELVRGLGYAVSENHPNSSPDEPLIWSVKRRNV